MVYPPNFPYSASIEEDKGWVRFSKPASQALSEPLGALLALRSHLFPKAGATLASDKR